MDFISQNLATLKIILKTEFSSIMYLRQPIIAEFWVAVI